MNPEDRVHPKTGRRSTRSHKPDKVRHHRRTRRTARVALRKGD